MNQSKLASVKSNCGVYLPALAGLDHVGGRQALLYQEGLVFLSSALWMKRDPDLSSIVIGFRDGHQARFTPLAEIRDWIFENRPDLTPRPGSSTSDEPEPSAGWAARS